MDFVRRFETHQIERIRRAVIAYRDKHDVGDVVLTKEILRYLPKNVTYDSTLKNVQRLRNGENMRGATFLNACVQFLEVEMVTPPEEGLGLAMKQFVGDGVRYEKLWKELEGDYGLRVLGETAPDFSGDIFPTLEQGYGVPIRPTYDQPSVIMFAELSISQGESLDYGVAKERHYLRKDEAADDEDSGEPAENWIDRKGFCLPIGRQDLLIMIRDFRFSHMYVLTREPSGFSGRLVLPSPYETLTGQKPAIPWQSQYDVVLQQVPRAYRTDG
ncbi:hypothetical protein [Microbaculum marinisediminis]|uniref:Uncharacterized protein n=1 Tax=Microbaculum marinisediminis TaxID=2931392 RepID=A0AAW5QUY6_9HYPH|nr:hypothetical protein [Microbaculum sp. A6E488]MCT8970797.1 hypothetical protein [Microbaculum sp. A6E488]